MRLRRSIPLILLILAPLLEALPGPPQAGVTYRIHSKIGFRSERVLREEFRKHGREFGKITLHEFLQMAQELRDRPLDMKILESVRYDKVVTRFDRNTGAFIAFERNLVIRSFFKPGDGERYFYRQLKRPTRRR
jgi:pyocin large subunit-like protein